MSEHARPQPFSAISENQTIRTILEGTASETGDAFFHSLVRSLAAALHVRHCWVTEFVEGDTRIRALAFWNGAAFHEEFEYELAGTPCERVLESEFVHHARGVQSLYPRDTALAEMAAESYVGVPLVREGRVLGHLAVMDDRPIETRPTGLSIFTIFAARAAAELWRVRIEAELRELEQRVGGIVTSAMDAIVALNERFEVEVFNPAAEEMFGSGQQESLGASLEDLFTPEACPRVAEQLSALHGSREAKVRLPAGLKLKRRNGEEFPSEGSASFLEVQGRPLYTLFLRDVSQRVASRKEIERLNRTTRYLQDEIEDTLGLREVIGESPPMKAVQEAVLRVAPTDATVLITGETGAGKEQISRSVHAQSPRVERPFVKVNCGTLPAGLVESELFGHERGAFTGASSRRIGRFELADGGTIFLDEVGDLPLDAQVKLLRVIQEGEFERVGGSDSIRVDVRILAATHRDLLKEVNADRFREDLFYRLNVFPIRVPSLRERREEIPRFAQHFVAKYAVRFGRTITGIADESLERLSQYPWPGNVRELENIIERSLILNDGPVLRVPAGILEEPTLEIASEAGDSLAEVERRHLTRVLTKAGWVIDGDRGAAQALGLHSSTLRNRMRKHGIERPG